MSHSKESKLDKSPIPEELTTALNKVEVKDILALTTTDKFTFKYGDFIPGAHAFNQYLEANISPGTTKTMTRNQIIGLIKHLAITLSTGGLNNLSMICLGEECPRHSECPLVKMQEAVPIGQNCPIEATEILNHVRQLSQDFGQHRSYADQIMINAIAGLEVLKTRIYADMSTNPDPIIEVEKGIDARGNVVKDKVENPNFKTLNSLLKQEQSLLKGLHLTQEQRIKLDTQGTRSSDVLISEMRERLNNLKRTNRAALDIKEADFKQVTIEDEDDSEDQEIHDKSTGEASPRGTETVSVAGGQPKVDAGDIAESLGNIRREKKDYRSAERTGTGRSDKPYIGRSPFAGGGKQAGDSHSGPDANSMEEAK